MAVMDKAEIYATLNRAYFSDEPHEKEVVEHLHVLLREVSVALDVGASLGQYTRAIAQTLRNAEIHAVEADPVRAEQLEQNCAGWAAVTGNRVVVHHLALTEETGTTTYFVTNSDISGGLQPHGTPRPVDWDQISVPGSTLDDLFPTRSPDFVKIDVEGAELQVLRGATRVLASGPTLLIELHDWDGSGQSREVRALLRRRGYHSASFYGQPVFTTSRGLWLKLKALELRSPRSAWLPVRAGLGQLKRRVYARRK
jgi:FkbM family methyltransferase